MNQFSNGQSEIECCPICKTILIFSETPNLTHYGRLDCKNCNRWIKWVKNPIKEKYRTKTSINQIQKILQYHNYNEEFCFFCLRNKSQLGLSETMTIDHIKELQEGGEDSCENSQILCSACHKLKNWSRLYLNWHLSKEVKKDGNTEATTI